MRIAVIGAGKVGTALGRAFVKGGHDVVYGVRPGGSRERLQEGERSAEPREAAADAELVLLATPGGPAALEAAAGAGPLAGKILVDATNGMAGDPSDPRSGAERLAASVEGARVVKAFNTIGFEVMADPRFGEDRALLLCASDDEEAAAAVASLAEGIGFDALTLRGLEKARLLEAQARLWIELAMRQGYGRGIAFGLLRR